MTDERCACGKFLAMPGGMAQIEDGVYHVPAGAPACEVIDLRAKLAAAEESDKESIEMYRRARDRAEAAESREAEALEVLREVEWFGFGFCPVCNGEKPQGHYKDCSLASVLARSRGDRGGA